ncbi:MAG: 30S ribosomal protein S8 [Patescibacteria group bacterium]
MNDQIADLLARIRNAAAIGKDEIVLPASKLKEVILKILKREGYVLEVQSLSKNKTHRLLKVTLSPESYPRHLRQISKPGQRIYARAKDIPRPLRGLGLVIISTPQGVISGQEARKKGVGGELICEVW